MATTINIPELKKAVNLILDRVAETNGEEITVNHDMYWHIEKECAYNPYAEPTDLTIGQLDEDWSHLRRIATRQDEPIGYALVWASSILKTVGEDVP